MTRRGLDLLQRKESCDRKRNKEDTEQNGKRGRERKKNERREGKKNRLEAGE